MRKSPARVPPPSRSPVASESTAVYLHFKALFTGKPQRTAVVTAPPSPMLSGGEAVSLPYGIGRDPRVLGEVVESLTNELGWGSQLDSSALLAAWPSIVGEAIAAKARPVGVDGVTLVIECTSTPWATQLRLMRSQLLKRIIEDYPRAGIESIRVNGPDVPSWKKGFRSVPGRGVRDTYG